MFKRNVSPNLRGKTRQHYRCEINNGIYEGDMLHYKKDGIGIFIHDDGSVYAGSFSHDVFHGEGILLYKRQGILYCQFEKGIPNGWCVMNLNGSYICGQLSQSFLHGSVFYYSKEKQLWQYLEYQSGKQVRKYAEEQTDDIKRVPSFMKKDSIIYQKLMNFLEFRVESIFKKNVEMSLSLLASDEDPLQKCIGFVTKDKHLNGLGFIFNNDSIQMSGSYKEGKISGLGRINHANGDIYEGYFRQDEMEGQGIYFTKNTDSYVRAIFRHNDCVQVISQGSGYPSELCRKMKQRAHQKSIQYMDSNINLSQIRINLPSLFKSVQQEALASTKTLKDYFFIAQDQQVIQKSLTSNQPEVQSGYKNSSPNSKSRLNRPTSAQPFSAAKLNDLTASTNILQHSANNFQNQRVYQEIPTLSQKYENYLNELQQVPGQDTQFTEQDINNSSFNRFIVNSQQTIGQNQSPTRHTKRFLPIFQNHQLQNSRNASPLNNLQSSISNSNLGNSAAFSPSKPPSQENRQTSPSILITNSQQQQYLVQSKSQSRISYNQSAQSQQFKQLGYPERESVSPSKLRKYKPIFASQSLSSLKQFYNPLESSQIQNSSPHNFPKTSQTFYQDTPTSLKKSNMFKQDTSKFEQENEQKQIGQTQLNQKLKILINQQKQYSPSFKSQLALPFGDSSILKDQQGKSNSDIYHSFKNNFGLSQSPQSVFSPIDKIPNNGLISRKPFLQASQSNMDPQIERQKQQDIPVNQGIQLNQQL